MSTKITTFKPAGPVEAAWRRSRAPVKILLGAISSGKSTGAVSHITELAMQMPPMADGIVRARVLVVRNTYGALESATLRTIETVFPRTIGTLVKASPMRRMISLPGFELEFILLALDNPAVSLKSALGMEATFAWLDEVREIPVETLQTVLGRIGRFPPVREVGAPYYARSRQHRISASGAPSVTTALAWCRLTRRPRIKKTRWPMSFFIDAWKEILRLDDIRPAPTNSVEIRIEAARSITNRLSDGRPAVIIDPQCRHLIKALAGEWRFRQKRTPMGMLSEDTEIDKGPNTRPYSDLGDAFSYLVLASGEAGVLSRVARPRRADAVVGGFDDENWMR